VQDLIEQFFELGRPCACCELNRSKNHGQQVVEVVGHATGELANRLHFLRVTQSLLHANRLGDVQCRRKGCRATLVFDQGRPDLPPLQFSIVEPTVSVVAGCRVSRFPRSETFDEDLEVLWMHHLAEELRGLAPQGRPLGSRALVRVHDDVVLDDHHVIGRFVCQRAVQGQG
jgi:hypothetical protein